MIRLRLDLTGPDTTAALINLLLTAADRTERRNPELADEWRTLANGIGDGLDALDPDTPEHPDPAPRKPYPHWINDPEIDELAVERVVRGHLPYPQLTRAEALAASERLTQQGASSLVIAERTGVVRRTVHRWRGQSETA